MRTKLATSLAAAFVLTSLSGGSADVQHDDATLSLHPVGGGISRPNREDTATYTGSELLAGRNQGGISRPNAQDA